jgi:hypothetical protein
MFHLANFARQCMGMVCVECRRNGFWLQFLGVARAARAHKNKHFRIKGGVHKDVLAGRTVIWKLRREAQCEGHYIALKYVSLSWTYLRLLHCNRDCKATSASFNHALLSCDCDYVADTSLYLVPPAFLHIVSKDQWFLDRDALLGSYLNACHASAEHL